MNSIKIRDIHEFLQMQLDEHQYQRILALVQNKIDFYISFKLKYPVNDIENVIIFMKNNRFTMQFIPKHLEDSLDFDKLAPDVIVFVRE